MRKSSAFSAGMSLVQTMVTMSIASGLVIAVLEAINYSSKQSKSAQVTHDWSAVVNNLRMVLNNPTQCEANFKGLTIPAANIWSAYPITSAGTTAYTKLCNSNTASQWTTPQQQLASAGCTATTQLDNLRVFNITSGSGTPVSTLVSATANLNNIRAVYIGLAPAPNEATRTRAHITSTGPSGWDYVDTFGLEIEAVKVTAGGSGLKGGNTQLYSGGPTGWNSPGPQIFVDLVRDGTGTVKGCYGFDDKAQEFCSDIGGFYGPTGNEMPRCQLENLSLSRNNYLGPISSTPGPSGGTKLTLERSGGAWATPAINDYAIGYDNNQIWFSAGSLPTGGYKWYNQTTSTGTSMRMRLKKGMGPSAQTDGLLVSQGAVVASNTTAVPVLPTTAPLYGIAGVSNAPTAGSVLAGAPSGYYGFVTAGNGINWFQGPTQSDSSMYRGSHLANGYTIDMNYYQYHAYNMDEWMYSWPYQYDIAATQETHASFYEYHWNSYVYQEEQTFSMQGATYNEHYGKYIDFSPWIATRIYGQEYHYGPQTFTGGGARIYMDSSATGWVFGSATGLWSVQSTAWFDGAVYVGNGVPVGSKNGFIKVISGHGLGGNVPHNCTWEYTTGISFPNGTTLESRTCSHGVTMRGGCFCSTPVNDNAGSLGISHYGPSGEAYGYFDSRWWCRCEGGSGGIYQVCCDI